jgi:hypothetical protein
MLLGHGCTSAGQQVLNKDIEYKSHSKVQLKRRLEPKPIELQVLKGRVNVGPNGINAMLPAVLQRYKVICRCFIAPVLEKLLLHDCPIKS